jgi:hypothetical protein
MEYDKYGVRSNKDFFTNWFIWYPNSSGFYLYILFHGDKIEDQVGLRTRVKMLGAGGCMLCYVYFDWK